MTWDYDLTRFWTDDNDQEWVCIPWDPNRAVPEQLRSIADQWQADNEAHRGP